MLTKGVVAEATVSGLDNELLGGSQQDHSIPIPKGPIDLFRVGFRSNGTMAGKIRWSMFLSCPKDSLFNPVEFLQKWEPQVETSPCVGLVFGRNGLDSPEKVYGCYLETRRWMRGCSQRNFFRT